MRKIPRVAYTLEYKLEAVRRVRSGEAMRRVAREIGVAEQTLRNWSKAQAAGKLGGAEKGKPITPEQMEISRLRAENARLRMEAEILKKPPRTLRRSRCEVRVHRATSRSYPLPALCAALQVSDSGFATWQRADGPRKWLSDSVLLKLMREIDEETKAAYGSPRIYQELKARGIPVSKGRVERLMRENDLRARHKRRFKATTDSKHSLPVAPNRLEQNFETARPDQVWTADITYIATREGWLYLAVVLDLYDRQIVGWAMRERMTQELVIDALRMAWFRRHPSTGLIHHSDRGSQYCSHDFQKQLAEYAMLASMSRKGNCWDNAPSESFFNSLKNERVHGVSYETRDAARADVFEYIEVFYNRSRRHSALGGVSPTSFYDAWLKKQSEPKLAA